MWATKDFLTKHYNI